MKSQQASPNFTNVYAALVAVVNTKLPQVGELLCKRLVSQWKKSYFRNQKVSCFPQPPLCRVASSPVTLHSHFFGHVIVAIPLLIILQTLLISTTTFIAHLVNQYVIDVMVPLQILALLLDKPTDDSVEVLLMNILCFFWMNVTSCPGGGELCQGVRLAPERALAQALQRDLHRLPFHST